MKERLKLLRKTVGLNQKKFGEKIGITGAAICNYENGSRSLTEQVIISVCREFNVNRSWLVDGIGEMFSNLPETLLDELTSQYQLTESEKEFILEFCKLPKEHRKIVLNFMHRF